MASEALRAASARDDSLLGLRLASTCVALLESLAPELTTPRKARKVRDACATRSLALRNLTLRFHLPRSHNERSAVERGLLASAQQPRRYQVA